MPVKPRASPHPAGVAPPESPPRATSAARLAANRANAKKSTGPRTAAGKARVAGNARRHGFNRPAWWDPANAAGIEQLARMICGLGDEPAAEERADSPPPCGEGHRIWHAVSSPSRRLGGEGRDKGAHTTGRTRGESPHPDPLPASGERGKRGAPPCLSPPTPEHILEHARRIAEAQADLVRVRQARHGILGRALADPKYRSWRGNRARIAMLGHVGDLLREGIPLPAEMVHAFHHRHRGPHKFILILGDFSRELAAFDRYERRALSRRKAAVRAYDEAVTEAPRGTRMALAAKRAESKRRNTARTATAAAVAPAPARAPGVSAIAAPADCRPAPLPPWTLACGGEGTAAFWRNKANQAKAEARCAALERAIAAANAPKKPAGQLDMVKIKEAARRVRELLHLGEYADTAKEAAKEAKVETNDAASANCASDATACRPP